MSLENKAKGKKVIIGLDYDFDDGSLAVLNSRKGVRVYTFPHLDPRLGDPDKLEYFTTLSEAVEWLSLLPAGVHQDRKMFMLDFKEARRVLMDSSFCYY